MTDALTKADLAEALECFWNAAIGATHDQQDGAAVIGPMAQGFAAVALRLRELDAPPAPSEDLRQLRLWHWEQLVLARRAIRKAWGNAEAKRQAESANFHLSAVEALNDFFLPDDTAERDYDAKHAVDNDAGSD